MAKERSRAAGPAICTHSARQIDSNVRAVGPRRDEFATEACNSSRAGFEALTKLELPVGRAIIDDAAPVKHNYNERAGQISQPRLAAVHDHAPIGTQMIAKISTANQLAKMRPDGNRYELVEGVLSMMSPAGGRHGKVAGRVFKLLANHVDDNSLGVAFAAETGFLIATNPDTVRAPDAAFVRRDKMDSLKDDSGFLPFAPDLAVEVVSPNDSFADVESKAFSWLDAGTQLVLIVEPESETVHAYRSRSNITVLRSGEALAAADVVAGWSARITDIFA